MTDTEFETIEWREFLEVPGLGAFRKMDDTGEAYDQCQCDDELKTGTVFVVPSERVVGLSWAWPLAVTQEYGNLHTTLEGDPGYGIDEKLPRERFEEAVRVARALGYEIRDVYRELV